MVKLRSHRQSTISGTYSKLAKRYYGPLNLSTSRTTSNGLDADLATLSPACLPIPIAESISTISYYHVMQNSKFCYL